MGQVPTPKTEWIEVNPDELALDQDREVRGVTLRLRLSPYDVPLAVTGRDEGGCFFVKFRYITEDEKTTREQKDDHLWLHVGKNTGRLYAIEIDVNALKAHTVRLEVINSAIDQMAQQQEQRRGNYAV